MYVCIVPGSLLRWRIPRETSDRHVFEGLDDIDRNGFRSIAGVHDRANDCFNSTLTFNAETEVSIVCLAEDQLVNQSVTVVVQGV